MGYIRLNYTGNIWGNYGDVWDLMGFHQQQWEYHGTRTNRIWDIDLVEL